MQSHEIYPKANNNKTTLENHTADVGAAGIVVLKLLEEANERVCRFAAKQNFHMREKRYAYETEKVQAKNL